MLLVMWSVWEKDDNSDDGDDDEDDDDHANDDCLWWWIMMLKKILTSRMFHLHRRLLDKHFEKPSLWRLTIKLPMWLLLKGAEEVDEFKDQVTNTKFLGTSSQKKVSQGLLTAAGFDFERLSLALHRGLALCCLLSFPLSLSQAPQSPPPQIQMLDRIVCWRNPTDYFM